MPGRHCQQLHRRHRQHLPREVVGHADTDPVKHTRLAAIERGRALRGSDIVADWRGRAGQYPDRLVAAIVERALDPALLVGWSARQALAERRDDVALHVLFSVVEQCVLAALMALNRTYQPHRLFKWQRELVGTLDIRLIQFNEKLRGLWGDDRIRALAVAGTLLAETLSLAEEHSGAQLTDFREALASSRRPVEPLP